MKRFQLKNIVIFILVLANLYLAGILFQRYQEKNLAQERATAEMLTLFSSQGVWIDETFLSWDDPLQTLGLGQDLNLFQSMAQALLGDDATSQTIDNTVIYQSQAGMVTFSSDGYILANGQLGAENILELITDFCYTYGYENPVSILEDNSGTVSATATYRGISVNDTSITFTIEQGVLISVSGIVLPQTHTTTGASAQVSCLTALSHFLTTRRTTGAVVSAVDAVDACYTLSATDNTLTLLPIWRIVTDNGTYRVDGTTGAITYR